MFRPVAIIVSSVLSSAVPGACAEQPAFVNYMLHYMGCHFADRSGGPPDLPDVHGEMGRLLADDGER